MELSKRALNIKESSTLAISARATELKNQGENVINFSVGEPDYNTFDVIKKAGIAAINENFTKYTPVAGIAPLREAIAKKLLDQNELKYNPSQIVVSGGAKQSLYNTFFAILNEGDEVIIPAPYWLSYFEMVTVCGGVPVVIETKEENNFILQEDELKNAYTSKTKAIIFTSPSNPTGVVMDKKDLEMIANFACEKDLFVISDEIYEHLIYNENKKHISIASLNNDIFARTIVINGLSKSHAMTGWRIGYTASSVELAKIMTNFQSQTTSGANSIAQKAAVTAIKSPIAALRLLIEDLKKRADYIYDRQQNIPLLTAVKPDGAFYLLINVTQCYGKSHDGNVINSAADFATYLLDAKKVALVPCADFGAKDYIRISFATSMNIIEDGMNRLEQFVSELN